MPPLRPRNPAMSAAMARKGHNFTTLSKATGILPGHLGRICSRYARPNLNTAYLIAKALECTIEELNFIGEYEPEEATR